MKTLIFDLGGVILPIDYHRAVRRFESLGLHDAAKMMDPYTQMGFFGELELGHITAEEFRQRLSQEAGRPLTYAECLDGWLGYMLPLPHWMFDTLDQLRASGRRMVVLSNTNPFIVDWASQPNFDGRGHNLFHYFDAAYFSYQAHYLKPDARFFQHVLDAEGIQPGDALFLDDGPRNVAAAEALGIQTICPQNGSDWRPALFEALASE